MLPQGGRRNEIAAHLIPDSVEPGPDLALLQLTTRNVPALLLNESETLGTPAAAPSDTGSAPRPPWGCRRRSCPGIKVGTLGPSRVSKAAPGQQLTLIDAPISRGDSGAPGVDAEATVHGIVRFTTQTGGALEQSQAIFDELQRLGIPNTNGPVFRAFERGMDAFWARQYVTAAAAFALTARLDPTHPLATSMAHSANLLARQTHPARHPRWWRPMFVGISALAMLGLLFGVRRMRALRHARDSASDHPDGFPASG